MVFWVLTSICLMCVQWHCHDTAFHSGAGRGLLSICCAAASAGLQTAFDRLLSGRGGSCRSRVSGLGVLACLTTRLNNLTVRFQGRVDYRQSPDSAECW